MQCTLQDTTTFTLKLLPQGACCSFVSCCSTHPPIAAALLHLESISIPLLNEPDTKVYNITHQSGALTAFSMVGMPGLGTR